MKQIINSAAMQRTVFFLFCGVIGFLFSSPYAYGQEKVIFRVDLKTQIEDSTFVPGNNDQIYITGNQFPLNPRRRVRLHDRKPIDSVYSKKVDFPSLSVEKTLEYNYVIENKEGILEESRPRFLILEEAPHRELDVAYFNTYLR